MVVFGIFENGELRDIRSSMSKAREEAKRRNGYEGFLFRNSHEARPIRIDDSIIETAVLNEPILSKIIKAIKDRESQEACE